MTLRPMAITPAAPATSSPTLLHGAGRAPPLRISPPSRRPIQPRAQFMANFAPPLIGADGSNVKLGTYMAPATHLDEAGAVNLSCHALLCIQLPTILYMK
jgi:hypothetical protein